MRAQEKQVSNSPSQNQNKQKPTRLGRGLGSLLGGASDFDETPAQPAPSATHSPASPAQPAAPAKSSAQGVNAFVGGAGATAKSSSAAGGATIAVPVYAQPLPIAEESQIWMLPIDRLTANTQQPRQIFAADGLRDLTASIKEKGILQPIVARRLSERQFEIIAGERRWRAAQAAGLHEVPVILKKVSEQDSLEYAIIENIQRENLNPMEEADAFEHLMHEYSLTQQEVADKLGKERATVANTLRLLNLAPEVKVLVRNNELSAGHAKVLLSLEDKGAQTETAKEVVAQKLSVRATEKLVAKAKASRRATAAGSASLNLDVPQRLVEGLSTELQKLLGTKVTIDYADSKGKLSIHFYSDDQLQQVVEKLRGAWEK
jgi:ParB family chromosome partitioning protein